MQIKLTTSQFISEHIRNPQQGTIHTVTDEVGRHLVACDVAIELKIKDPVSRTKKEKPSSASRRGRRSRGLTSKDVATKAHRL